LQFAVCRQNILTVKTKFYKCQEISLPSTLHF
jgi:hypothetical protein